MKYGKRNLAEAVIRNFANQGPEITLEKGKTINIVEGCVEGNQLLVALSPTGYDVLMKLPDAEVKIGNRARLASKQLLKRIEDQTQVIDRPVVVGEPTAFRQGRYGDDQYGHQQNYRSAYR